MTDVELLPLPSPQVPFIDCDPSMTDIRRLVRWYEQGATEYARANVSHAAAPLQAEIKALRAEVERLRADRDSWEQQASDRVADWYAEHLRAERLAEALALLPDEIVMVEHNPDGAPRMFCCGRKVKLTWLHDLQPTHNEECWYARMRAMRDAALAQEDCNG